MPLHDWSDDRGWDSVHQPWITHLVDWIRPRLPEDYRVYAGSVPALSVGTPNGRPDVNVRRWEPSPPRGDGPNSHATPLEPDGEVAVTFELDPQHAVHVARRGFLIAAVELVSPRNKDRPDSRQRSLTRYAGYLRQGVHLLLVDVLPRPAGHSFADAVAADLGLDHPPTPAPFASSYRVGEPAEPGTMLAYWRRPLRVGGPLPTLPLALNVHQAVSVDLEATYTSAARLAYLD